MTPTQIRAGILAGTIVVGLVFLGVAVFVLFLPRCNSKVTFAESEFRVKASEGRAVIKVIRTGDVSEPVTVKYATEKQPAKPQLHYHPVSGELTFKRDERYKTFDVQFVKGQRVPPIVTVRLVLKDLAPGNAILGELSESVLTIVGDAELQSDRRPDTVPEHKNGAPPERGQQTGSRKRDESLQPPPPSGPTVGFASRTFEAYWNAGSAPIAVRREGDLTSSLTVEASAGGGTARNGVHYEAGSITLRFRPGEAEHLAYLMLPGDEAPTELVTVNLELRLISGRATLAKETKAELMIRNDPYEETPIPGTLLTEIHPSYEARRISGFLVLLSKRAIAESQLRKGRPFRALTTECDGLNKVLPSRTVSVLQRVKFVVEWDLTCRENQHAAAQYMHRRSKYSDQIEKIFLINSIVVYSLKHLEWEKRQLGRRSGLLFLHELAHAVHDHVVLNGFSNATVAHAYRRAKYEGIYDRTQDVTGKIGSPYAMTNEAEYFAELSRAYLDLAPFSLSRDPAIFVSYSARELERWDPLGFAMMQEVWGKRSISTTPTSPGNRKKKE